MIGTTLPTPTVRRVTTPGCWAPQPSSARWTITTTRCRSGAYSQTKPPQGDAKQRTRRCSEPPGGRPQETLLTQTPTRAKADQAHHRENTYTVLTNTSEHEPTMESATMTENMEYTKADEADNPRGPIPRRTRRRCPAYGKSSSSRPLRATQTPSSCRVPTPIFFWIA